MATVKGKGKPQGFRLMPQGEQTLKITKVTGLPRTNVTVVDVEFVNSDGIPLKNSYNLEIDGGYAAFYFLVLNGMGVDLDEGDEFDIDELAGKYVQVEIVHKEGSKARDDGTFPVFANIAKTIGPGEAFDGDDGDEW